MAFFVTQPDSPLAFGDVPVSHQDRPRITSGQILVALKPGVDSNQFSQATGLTLTDEIPQLGVLVVSVPNGQEEASARQLSLRPDVLYAEPDGMAYEMASPLSALPSSETWFLQQICVPADADLPAGAGKTIVAVVDTGADLQHPDLQGDFVAGYDFVHRSATPTDDEGHGTHVTGLALSVANAGDGSDTLRGALIMPVKVLNSQGAGSNSTISKGITWASDHGAKVINMSLGGSDYSTTLASAVKYAQNKGVLILVAAGNEYLTGDPLEYPAALPNVIAVGASTNTDARASYSNTGDYLGVVAPGGDPTSNRDTNPSHWITSTFPTNLGGEYEAEAGTSMATPIVSGLAALLLSVKPSLTADQVRQIIEQTADDLGTTGWDANFGYGRINVTKALNAISPSSSSAPIVVPGDLNGDGVVNVADATLALQAATGILNPTAMQLKAGDVTPTGALDGKITISDATRILQIAVGIDPLTDTGSSPTIPGRLR